jgi:hypothetical protein
MFVCKVNDLKIKILNFIKFFYIEILNIYIIYQSIYEIK